MHATVGSQGDLRLVQLNRKGLWEKVPRTLQLRINTQVVPCTPYLQSQRSSPSFLGDSQCLALGSGSDGPDIDTTLTGSRPGIFHSGLLSVTV